MNEKELIQNLVEIDGLLSRCTNPALRRDEQKAIEHVMQMAIQRVKLSYQLEAERKEAETAEKEEVPTKE